MHNPLSKKAREMFFGSLFGDSGVYKSTGSRHYHAMICHSPKQKEYLMWKEELLKPLSTGIKNQTHFHKIRKKEYTTSTLRTTNHSYFTRLRKMFYPEGKKVVTRKLLNKLTPIGLATWFMDDGTSCENNRGYPTSSLCTNSMSLEENNIIQEYFKDTFGIETRVHVRKGFPSIYFNRPNTLKFIEIIKEHLHPSMLYKIRFFTNHPTPEKSVEDIV